MSLAKAVVPIGFGIDPADRKIYQITVVAHVLSSAIVYAMSQAKISPPGPTSTAGKNRHRHMRGGLLDGICFIRGSTVGLFVGGSGPPVPAISAGPELNKYIYHSFQRPPCTWGHCWNYFAKMAKHPCCKPVAPNRSARGI
jgi:hypothetical protein